MSNKFQQFSCQFDPSYRLPFRFPSTMSSITLSSLVQKFAVPTSRSGFYKLRDLPFASFKNFDITNVDQVAKARREIPQFKEFYNELATHNALVQDEGMLLIRVSDPVVLTENNEEDTFVMAKVATLPKNDRVFYGRSAPKITYTDDKPSVVRRLQGVKSDARFKTHYVKTTKFIDDKRSTSIVEHVCAKGKHVHSTRVRAPAFSLEHNPSLSSVKLYLETNELPTDGAKTIKFLVTHFRDLWTAVLAGKDLPDLAPYWSSYKVSALGTHSTVLILTTFLLSFDTEDNIRKYYKTCFIDQSTVQLRLVSFLRQNYNVSIQSLLDSLHK